MKSKKEETVVMSRSEWDALNGLKEGANCCSFPNHPVYPKNVRPKNRAVFWIKLVITLFILGVVGYGML